MKGKRTGFVILEYCTGLSDLSVSDYMDSTDLSEAGYGINDGAVGNYSQGTDFG